MIINTLDKTTHVYILRFNTIWKTVNHLTSTQFIFAMLFTPTSNCSYNIVNVL